jgi:hypothetical protein
MLGMKTLAVSTNKPNKNLQTDYSNKQVLPVTFYRINFDFSGGKLSTIFELRYLRKESKKSCDATPGTDRLCSSCTHKSMFKCDDSPFIPNQ